MIGGVKQGRGKELKVQTIGYTTSEESSFRLSAMTIKYLIRQVAADGNTMWLGGKEKAESLEGLIKNCRILYTFGLINFGDGFRVFFW
jgi:hypothetical protein